MDINFKSNIDEVVQAISGTWDISKSDDGWTCLEQGKSRLFNKMLDGSSPLPNTFIDRRNDITPYLVFHKDSVEGGVITLQDTAITANGLVLILQF